MGQLRHERIIRHYESFNDSESNLCIVMELAEGGDLSQVIYAQYKRRKCVSCGARGLLARRRPPTAGPSPRALPSRRYFHEDRIWKYLVQLVEGLNYIHSKRILHRDMKSQNVFLDRHGNVKIGDFGLGRSLSPQVCACTRANALPEPC